MTGLHSLEKITKDSKTKATGSVIWLHGLGADGHDFVDIVPQLRLPEDLSIRFIFPHAPIRPVTVNAKMRMRAWYDIYSLNDLANEDEAGILQTEKSIDELIRAEIDNGIASDRIILAGFSQGGAMALFSGLRYPKPLGGILALSTYLPLANHSPLNPANQQIPIFMAHGRFDPVLPLSLGQQSYALLKKLNYPIEWHEYPMEHQVCYEEIIAAGQWLSTIFSR